MKLVRAGVIVLIAAYVAIGIHSQVVHLATKPLPQFLMEDYGYYARAFARWQAGQSPYADHTIGTAFLYPPPSLLLVGGLEALGPLPIKFAGYATASLLALIGALVLVVWGTRARLADSLWVGIALALAFAPVAWCLYLGQVNLFVMFTLAAGFYLADRYPYAAGAAIAVGASIKLTPVVLLVMMLQRRHWPVFVGFGATLAVLVLSTGAIFGFSLFGDYVGTVRALKDSFPLGLNGSISLLNTLYLLAGALGLPTEGWYGPVQLLYTGAIGALMLAGAWLTRDGRNRTLFFALVTIGMTVMPNVLWAHHLVFLIPALLTLWLSPESTPTLRTGAVIVFAVVQLDTLLSPKLDKLTTTPVCLLLLGITFATLLPRVSLPARSLTLHGGRAVH